MEPSKQIRAVAQTYLQEQQLREQAEYITVLENIIAGIANEFGVEPQALIEGELLRGKEAHKKMAELAAQGDPNAVKFLKRVENLGKMTPPRELRSGSKKPKSEKQSSGFQPAGGVSRRVSKKALQNIKFTPEDLARRFLPSYIEDYD